MLVPIGPLPVGLLEHLQRELPPLVNADITIAPEIPRPSNALDPARQQYLGDSLLEELKQQNLDADRVVGIIDADTYARGLNFIFGQSMKPGRFAVISVARFHGPRFQERALKVTTHEIGHSFGFAHCAESQCVMRFANSLRELDSQGGMFCKRDLGVGYQDVVQRKATDRR